MAAQTPNHGSVKGFNIFIDFSGSDTKKWVVNMLQSALENLLLEAKFEETNMAKKIRIEVLEMTTKPIADELLDDAEWKQMTFMERRWNNNPNYIHRYANDLLDVPQISPFLPLKEENFESLPLIDAGDEELETPNNWSEAKYLEKSSNNLVQILGYYWEEMQKGSLENYLIRKGPEPISWDIRLKIAREVASSLAFLHTSGKSIIYRDLKPSNILLDAFEEIVMAKKHQIKMLGVTPKPILDEHWDDIEQKQMHCSVEGRIVDEWGLRCRGIYEHDLVTAVQHEGIGTVKSLLERYPTLLHPAIVYRRNSALHIAAANGHREHLSMILDVLSRRNQTDPLRTFGGEMALNFFRALENRITRQRILFYKKRVKQSDTIASRFFDAKYFKNNQQDEDGKMSTQNLHDYPTCNQRETIGGSLTIFVASITFHVCMVPTNYNGRGALSAGFASLGFLNYLVFVWAVSKVILVGVHFTRMQSALLLFWAIILNCISAGSNSITTAYFPILGMFLIGWLAPAKSTMK